MKNVTPLQAVNQHLATIIYTLVGLLIPFVLLPIGDIFFVESKQLLLFVVAIVTVTLFAVRTISKKTIQVTFSPFFLPLMVFIGSVIVSSFFTVGLPIQHLLGFGGVMISAALIAVLGPTLLGEQKVKTILTPIGIGAAILAACSVLELLGFGPSKLASLLLKVPFDPNTFSLAGSHLIALQVFVATFVALLLSIRQTNKEEQKSLPIINLILVVIIGVGILTSGYQVFASGKQSSLNLPYQASWSVAVATFQSARSALLGVGPSNYSHAYLQFKPAWMNVTNLWDLQFNYASNLPLTLVTTVGLIGLVAWAAIAAQIVLSVKKAQAKTLPLAAFMLVTLIFQLLFPPNIIVLALQAIVLAFWVATDSQLAKDTQLHTFTVSNQRTNVVSQKMPEHSHLLAYGTAGLMLAAVGLSVYWVGRYSIAQAYVFQGNLKAINKDVLGLYDAQRQENIVYPYSDNFHRSYSSTNMAMAIGISNAKDLNEDQKGKAVTLVQQSIREAKVATELAPTNSSNWVNIARIYTNLIGVAQQSENWALSAYAQASATAPTDPGVQLEIGGLVYRLGRYEDASKVFEKTVQLKPNWANAYYNLANAYRMSTQSDKALAAYQQTLALIKDDPEQTKKLNDEIAAYVKTLPPVKPNPKTAGKAPVATPSSALAAPNSSNSAQFQPVANELGNAEIEGPDTTPSPAP